ncbi:thioesterase family protein [Patulibacter defluvii]|uniref:thioesterase family protein n=1 Tax=Patulibacter defluvii TaxID=3095358 RepID=UPI002A74F960|nr:thioesterase family protein [Patulibacter sp. DM4]
MSTPHIITPDHEGLPQVPEPPATAVALPDPDAPAPTPTPTEADADGPAEHVEHLLLTGAGRGPWDPRAAHGGAPAALLARAIERAAQGDDVRISTVAYTFYGPVPLGPIELRSRLRKPGRRQQIVTAELVAGGRVAMEARGILLRRGQVELPATVAAAWPELPPPEGARELTDRFVPEGVLGFHPDAIEIRQVEGGFDTLGDTATAWFRLRLPIVPGEQPTPFQRAATASDFGNGLAHPVSFADYLFVNCDLTVSLHRDPAGEWIGVRPRTTLDRAGTGLTTTELHDQAGRFGTATQTLFVDRA